jgi:hypothetical protein
LIHDYRNAKKRKDPKARCLPYKKGVNHQELVTHPFAHTERPMREMADLLKSGRYADEIMIRKPEEAARHAAMSTQSNPRKTGIQTKEEEE